MDAPYYNDPLAAAWMAKHFGMRFVDDNPKQGKDWAEGKTLYYEAARYNIHPESLHLLEPMVGDLCELRGNPQYDHYDLTWECILKRYDAPSDVEFDTENSGFYRGRLQEYLNRIIQRDGVAFMWPIKEQ